VYTSNVVPYVVPSKENRGYLGKGFPKSDGGRYGIYQQKTPPIVE